MCTTIIVTVTLGIVLSVVLLFRLMLSLSDFIGSWNSSWDGLYEKPEISYKENWDPEAWRFLSYLWQRRYLSLPDQNVIKLAEKVRLNFILAPTACLFVAAIWLLHTELAEFVCK